MNQLKRLEACGQSPWLDYLKRSLIEKGELHTLVARDGLKGVTSNPSIFEKAIGETEEYAEALNKFQAQADHSISAIYEHLRLCAAFRQALPARAGVQDSGEGRWTVEAAIEEAVPADVLSTALYASFRSRQQHTFGEKLLSAMRLGFGGHIEGRESIDPEPTSEALQGHPATQNAAD